MLMEKQRQIENLMDVPEDQCLKGEGWLRLFCKTWKIQEVWWHGEAGSVDLVAVEKECIHFHSIMAKYVMWDRWNIDESGLVIFAIPDRTLSSGPMNGRKQDKFHITVCFAVNLDGSEQMSVIFIGKLKQPQCFKKKKLTAMGFYYWNNKKAWMTSELFMEWVKIFDLKMRREMQQVLLTLDNFRGHFIAYTPRNTKLEFFKPNMTSYVQPLDAGIIHCFKAHYRSAVCICALDLDDLGEAEIFKLDLLEAMTIVHDAWTKVSSEMIANCWKHTGIMPEDAPKLQPAIPSNNSQDTLLLKSAWNLVSIMNAENDVSKALEAVNQLAPSSQSKMNAPPTQIALIQQLQTAETTLKNHLVELKQ
ncbi:uncharacterized protein ARMOST_03233 [Armillaria ostoyae]|uniref:DDE-1 domain-containing protein n=1 Tax=Armillaria ostoyae TaxID=47428 RepID=A0A284QTW8_ARMOS|nr:uncharacterized protein ARMOST_03233 [Armillaria ostoyae]